MGTEFQISYTLDVLFYIGCMIDQEKGNLYDEDIERFMPMLGTISDKYLEKLKKMNQSKPNFISHIVSVLVVNDHLHDWTTADLFDRHKRLVVMFKKTKQGKNVSSELKRFINSDFSKSMSLVKVIANDLQRLGFKKFWLEEKLPLLKERNAQCQKILSEFDIAGHVNSWIEQRKIPGNGQWYMLAYSGDHYKVLLDSFSVTSPIIAADQLFDRMMTYVLETASYRRFCKSLKPDPVLKAQFKGHEGYKSFKRISRYADTCFKMALKVYLLDGCGKVGDEVAVDYPFASEVLDYLRENEKPVGMAVGDYVTDMMRGFSKK